MHNRDFMATPGDLAPGLKAFEAMYEVKYVGYADHPADNIVEYHSATDIPDFGVRQDALRMSEQMFVVFPRACPVRSHPANDGSGNVLVYHFVDNPSSFFFEPGGYTSDGLVKPGAITVADECEPAVPLWRSFVRVVTKGFRKIDRWYFGPEAERLLYEGRCLDSCIGRGRVLRIRP